jgi:segregation and condensation protein B
MEQDPNIPKLEALLFVHGEPIGLSDIARILSLEEDAARAVIEEFKTGLTDANRGLMLLSHGDKYQLVTKPEVNSVLTEFVKQELDSELTPASLETLAIITYLGPVSKSRIEYFRGVNSTIILKNLGLRGLISRIPDPSVKGAWLYESSFELFRHLGVQKREDLPEWSALRDRFSAKETQDQSPATPQ